MEHLNELNTNVNMPKQARTALDSKITQTITETYKKKFGINFKEVNIHYLTKCTILVLTLKNLPSFPSTLETNSSELSNPHQPPSENSLPEPPNVSTKEIATNPPHSIPLPSELTPQQFMPLNLDAFGKLKTNHVGSDELPEDITVKTMNRYRNILPNPVSRVVLPQIGNDKTTTYINANYIKGVDGENNDYIAAQGPTPQSVIPFWRMLWENEVKVIIMVTKLMERTTIKCSRYWPDKVNLTGQEGIIKYGDVIVRVVKAEKKPGYKLAELKVWKEVQPPRQIKPPRTIRHYWFDSWPDHGVPESPNAVVGMLRDANNIDPDHVAPWVVHCSAGIGRTGTFIGIDLGMKMIDSPKVVTVEPLNIIKNMRNDRGGMVQTPEQYEFLHTVLSDYFAEHGKPVDHLYGNIGHDPTYVNLRYAESAAGKKIKSKRRKRNVSRKRNNQPTTTSKKKPKRKRRGSKRKRKQNPNSVKRK